MSLALLGLGLGALNSVSTFIAGSKMKKEGEAGLRDFQHQTLTNVMQGIKPSFEIERLQALERSRTLASLIDVGAGMDAASAIGLLGTGVQTLEEGRAKDLASMLQQQEKYDLLSAEDEARMRQMKEARKMEELSSLKAQTQAGLETQVKSVTDLAATMISYGQGERYLDAVEGYGDKIPEGAIDAIGDKSLGLNLKPSGNSGLGYSSDYSFGGLGLGQRSKYSSMFPAANTMFPAANTIDTQKIMNFNSLFGGTPDNQYEDILFKRAL